MQTLGPIEKAPASGPVIEGIGTPLGEPPTLVTVKMRVVLSFTGTRPKSWVVGESVMLAGDGDRRQCRFLP